MNPLESSPRLRILALLLLALAGCVGLANYAAAAEPAGWGYDLADELMSPYCPGRALSECPSPQAEDLRREILEKERAGWSREDVEEALYERFGDSVLQAPRAVGVGLVAYAIPAVVIVLGAVLVGVFLRRQTATPSAVAPSAAAAPSHTPADAELERQVDEELGEGPGESW